MPGRRSAAPVTQNHLSKPEDLMFQYATLLRTSASGPLNSSDEHVSCTAPATENASLQILFKCPMPAIVFGNATKPSRFAHFWQGAQSLAPATQNDASTSKSGASMCGVLHILTSKCALRRNGVHFFDISSSKSDPDPSVFTLLTSKCASRHNCVLFRHLNFQTWSEHAVFCIFWLGNVLRATTACNFSSLIWPAGSAPAALESVLSEPPEPQIMGKTQCFATFLPFRAPGHSFFSLFLFLSSSLLWLFPSLLFICPYCRKFDFQTSFDNHETN